MLPLTSFTNCSWTLASLTLSLYSLAMLLLSVLSSLPSPLHLFSALELRHQFPVQQSLICLVIFHSARGVPCIWATLPTGRLFFPLFPTGPVYLHHWTAATPEAPPRLSSSSSPTALAYTKTSASHCLSPGPHTLVYRHSKMAFFWPVLPFEGFLIPVALPISRNPNSILLTSLEAITTAPTHHTQFKVLLPSLLNPLAKMLFPYFVSYPTSLSSFLKQGHTIARGKMLYTTLVTETFINCQIVFASIKTLTLPLLDWKILLQSSHVLCLHSQSSVASLTYFILLLAASVAPMNKQQIVSNCAEAGQASKPYEASWITDMRETTLPWQHICKAGAPVPH